jgi:hypothetical protein
MATLTLTQIAVMDEVIPDMRRLQFAIASAEKQCGEAACIAAEARHMYNEAIDDEKPYPVRNDLWGHCEFAERILSECKRQRDELKAALIAGMS